MTFPRFNLRDLFWLVLISVSLVVPDRAQGCCFRRRRLTCGQASPTVPAKLAASSMQPPAVLPKVVGFRTEVLLPDGWAEVNDDSEVSWAEDEFRHVPILEPNDFSQVEMIRMLKRKFNDPSSAWDEFARAKPGEKWVYGHPGVGNWEVKIEVRFKNER